MDLMASSLLRERMNFDCQSYLRTKGYCLRGVAVDQMPAPSSFAEADKKHNKNDRQHDAS